MQLPVENNYIKILKFLEAYAGDGAFHAIDEYLDVLGLISKKAKADVLAELKNEGFLDYKGGTQGGMSIVFRGGSSRSRSEFHQPTWYEKYEAKIKPAGSNHLSVITRPMKNFNINVGNNSNVVVDSKNITINNSEVFTELMETLILKVTNDRAVSHAVKTDALLAIKTALEESSEGKLKTATMENVLRISEVISSVGTFLFQVVKPMLSL